MELRKHLKLNNNKNIKFQNLFDVEGNLYLMCLYQKIKKTENQCFKYLT